ELHARAPFRDFEHPVAIANGYRAPSRSVSSSVPAALGLWVADHAPAGRVAPQRLDAERARGEGDVLRRGLAAAGDPRALVAVLRSAAVQPPAVGELVGDGPRELVALDDGDPSGRAEAVEVRPAGPSGVRDVREVGVGDVAVGRGRRAVPGAVAR